MLTSGDLSEEDLLYSVELSDNVCWFKAVKVDFQCVNLQNRGLKDVMKKLYYTIGEVSSLAGVKSHVLRYWETQFPDLNPSKNKAGKRLYTEKDLEVVLRLKELIRDKKYSTAGARKEIKGAPEDANEPIPMHVQRELKEIRFFLQSMLEKL